MKVYIEDHDQLTYIFKCNLKIKLKQDDKINKVTVSVTSQQFLLRTKKNQLYFWKPEEMQGPTQIIHEFQKV